MSIKEIDMARSNKGNKDTVVHAKVAPAKKNNDIVVKARLLCGEQGLQIADVCGRHNDRVIPQFINGGRYTPAGNLTKTKGGLLPNVCVESNPKLLKARTEKVVATLQAWIDEGTYTLAQMKVICAGYPKKFHRQTLKAHGLA
jgi:hypothetical protein